ncbi:Helitron helicase-like protein, partial [Phytophthora palmivora]
MGRNPGKYPPRTDCFGSTRNCGKGFMAKLKSLCKDLDEGVLGIQAARIHVVEYQKRGLPHAHILLIVRPEDKTLTAQDVDRLVSAEIPDKEKQPDLYETDLDEGVLGIQAARIHVVEYQKRGLPHAHILLIVRPEDKPLTAQDVDRLVSAEIPDKEKQPDLYETVITCMLHGPCGDANKNSPCMKNGKCSKKFPKPLADETTMAADKYPVYRRRRRPGRLIYGRKEWDNETVNQWVVPYNPFLSQKYNCHINVE